MWKTRSKIKRRANSSSKMGRKRLLQFRIHTIKINLQYCWEYPINPTISIPHQIQTLHKFHLHNILPNHNIITLHWTQYPELITTMLLHKIFKIIISVIIIKISIKIYKWKNNIKRWLNAITITWIRIKIKIKIKIIYITFELMLAEVG